jgi:hypothetical protein
MDKKAIFKSLPHINKIWVTKDGHFHLHPHNGGDEVKREDVEKEDNKKEDTKKVKEPKDLKKD